MSIKQLAKDFVELVEERDFIVEFEEEYNERCYEIDDILIPRIVNSIPSALMDDFNKLVNAILKARGNSPEPTI